MKQTKQDIEWLLLLSEARRLGITIEEIRQFLKLHLLPSPERGANHRVKAER
ncbi:anti-repressor SinI family protein [Bacillus massiliglaciei]|uniref:anti-repressor SinI family protein n=1 Tax=Bacillus massiliglaciei TaxID=1816693 RepID=UPI000DA614B4|nr:anti-repressor SinI family protein [Bacillus massiliglaciei]